MIYSSFIAIFVSFFSFVLQLIKALVYNASSTPYPLPPLPSVSFQLPRLDTKVVGRGMYGEKKMPTIVSAYSPSG